MSHANEPFCSRFTSYFTSVIWGLLEAAASVLIFLRVLPSVVMCSFILAFLNNYLACDIIDVHSWLAYDNVCQLCACSDWPTTMEWIFPKSILMDLQFYGKIIWIWLRVPPVAMLTLWKVTCLIFFCSVYFLAVGNACKKGDIREAQRLCTVS
jgi:hypothetical protein